METFQLGGGRIVVLAAVRGLVSEGERVRESIAAGSPSAVALSVGKEDLAGLETYDGAEHPPTNWEEELYVQGLRQWGDVRKPPPCFVEAVRAAKERHVPLRALDFDDEAYTEAYVTRVGTMDLLFHTRLEKRAQKHEFGATTPEAFVVEFDALVNDPESYAHLERAREERIAKRLEVLAKKHDSLLAVIEYERAAGVRRLLDGYRPTY